MAFGPLEQNSQEGLPARAYLFSLGETKWRYITGDRDLLLDGNLWKASPISDDGVKLSGDNTTDALTITTPSEIGPAQLFRGTPPSRTLGVVIYNYHRGDNQLYIEYVGEVMQADQPFPGTATLMCESMFASMERDGLRACWQRACRHALYDNLTCMVPKHLYAVRVDVVTADSGLVTGAGFATKPSGYFNGGFVEWEHPVRGKEFRAIEEHAGDQVRMFGDSDGMYYGLRLTAYPGCNRTPSDCVDRFDNFKHYGGCPDLDGTNPFDGNPVF